MFLHSIKFIGTIPFKNYDICRMDVDQFWRHRIRFIYSYHFLLYAGGTCQLSYGFNGISNKKQFGSIRELIDAVETTVY